MMGHDHKVVFVNASHQQILLPSTFRLLHHASRYDVFLKAFLDSAYRALLNETKAATAACSNADDHSKKFTLPESFVDLGHAASAQDLRTHAISLTTLAQIAVVLASRNDFKQAMRADFAAIWDPESSLTISLIQNVDVTNTLDVISKGIEMVRLACWIEFHLNIGYTDGVSGEKGRFFVSNGADGAAAVADRCQKTRQRFENTMAGLAFECTSTAVLNDLLPGGADDASHESFWVRKSVIPSLDANEWAQLRADLESRLRERDIKLALHCPSTSQQTAPPMIELAVNLDQLFSSLDLGRSPQHFQSTLDLLRKQAASSRVYAPRIELLLLGGSMRDRSAINATNTFKSLELDHVPVRLLDLLYPKDAHRFGDEPVKLSKVQGDPINQIAVIGMSCRVPGAEDADELWAMLKQGKDMCEEVSVGELPRYLIAYRFDADQTITISSHLGLSTDPRKAVSLSRLPFRVVPRTQRDASQDGQLRSRAWLIRQKHLRPSCYQ